MNKSIIKLALDALELKLIQERQLSRREGLEHDIESINAILYKTRGYQKELETEGSIEIKLI
tara:strand:- start:111 stop:296 length:186 start_codon:yes stop_codon:yes gene_type:complete